MAKHKNATAANAPETAKAIYMESGRKIQSVQDAYGIERPAAWELLAKAGIKRPGNPSAGKSPRIVRTATTATTATTTATTATASGLVCSNCGNEGAGKFCSECGGEMVAKPQPVADTAKTGHCVHCGKPVAGKFCSNCGKPVAAGKFEGAEFLVVADRHEFTKPNPKKGTKGGERSRYFYLKCKDSETGVFADISLNRELLGDVADGARFNICITPADD